MKTTLKRTGIILLVSAVAAVVANSVHPRSLPWVQDWSNQVEAKAKQGQIKVIALTVALEQFHARSVVFIDARSSENYARGHIPGAVSIPFESFDEQIPEINELIGSGQALIVYCKNRECDDALLLASELQSMGAPNPMLFIDGYESWQENGGAVEAEQ